VFVQSQAGHADWKTTLEIYTQQSSRSIDPAIRRLLNEFLGEPSGAANEDAQKARSPIHARQDVLL
jgi:hypothetical protein